MNSNQQVFLLALDAIIKLVALCAWIVGIVLAKGFWSTFFAVIFPLWGYILIAMHYVV